MKHCKDMYGKDYTLEDAIIAVPPKWKDLIIKCYNVCLKHDVAIYQIKEKYGGLRFYVSNAPQEVHNVIAKCEEISYTYKGNE